MHIRLTGCNPPLSSEKYGKTPVTWQTVQWVQIQVLLSIPIHSKNPCENRKTGVCLQICRWHPTMHFQHCILDDTALTTENYFGLMPINVSTQVHPYANELWVTVLSILPWSILPPVSAPVFHSLCWWCPSAQWICSFPCPQQLFSNFVTGKGASSASPFLNCAFPALLRNACHSSFCNLDGNALHKLLLYLLQICLPVFPKKFLSSFPCQSAPNLFSVLYHFFHSLLIFSISISEVSTKLYNIIFIWHEAGFHKKLGNPPVHNTKRR